MVGYGSSWLVAFDLGLEAKPIERGRLGGEEVFVGGGGSLCRGEGGGGVRVLFFIDLYEWKGREERR